MSNDQVQELKRQTRIQAGREAFKTCVAVQFLSLMGVIALAIKFPDVTLLSSPWFILGAPFALGLLFYWGVYASLTR